MSVEQQGRYLIQAKANHAEPVQIGANEEIFGVGQFGQTVCYNFKVDKAESNMDISLRRFSGVSTLLVNPKTAPAQIKDAKFVAVDGSNQFLRITQDQRAEVGPKRGQYFVCVFSHTFSSWSLTVAESSPEQQFDII